MRAVGAKLAANTLSPSSPALVRYADSRALPEPRASSVQGSAGPPKKRERRAHSKQHTKIGTRVTHHASCITRHHASRIFSRVPHTPDPRAAPRKLMPSRALLHRLLPDPNHVMSESKGSTVELQPPPPATRHPPPASAWHLTVPGPRARQVCSLQSRGGARCSPTPAPRQTPPRRGKGPPWGDPLRGSSL